MEKFFGLGTASSEYNSRRHINLIYYIFFQYRLLAEGQNFIQSYKSILQSKNEQNIIDYTVNDILGEYEFSFLWYLKNRYDLSNAEFDKVLSGITHHYSQVKSPAGYSAIDNWKLIIHMLYAQLCVKPEYRKYDIQIQTDYIIKIAQGMRGVSIDQSKWKLVGNSLNECLDKGWRNFDDLPEIEEYILSKIEI